MFFAWNDCYKGSLPQRDCVHHVSRTERKWKGFYSIPLILEMRLNDLPIGREAKSKPSSSPGFPIQGSFPAPDSPLRSWHNSSMGDTEIWPSALHAEFKDSEGSNGERPIKKKTTYNSNRMGNTKSTAPPKLSTVTTARRLALIPRPAPSTLITASGPHVDSQQVVAAILKGLLGALRGESACRSSSREASGGNVGTASSIAFGGERL